jgi:hypothetical protein
LTVAEEVNGCFGIGLAKVVFGILVDQNVQVVFLRKLCGREKPYRFRIQYLPVLYLESIWRFGRFTEYFQLSESIRSTLEKRVLTNQRRRPKYLAFVLVGCG